MSLLQLFKFTSFAQSLRCSQSPRRLAVTCLIALICLFWQASKGVQADEASANDAPGVAQGSNAQSPPDRYLISPNRLELGKEYEVLAHKADCQNEDLSEIKLAAPQGSGVVVLTQLPAGPCLIAAKVSVLSDASVGKSNLWLKNKDDKIISTVEIERVAIAAGPIPPGLEPQVDIMWGVMDKKVVRDNFGHDLANDFYGIQLVIGNNSGYDLQIAGVGFQLPNIDNTIPTNSYRATRGVLEREQEFGRRSIILNSIQATGGLLTGFLPFWRAGFHPNAAANAARWSSIVGGPLATGFGLIVPDTTVKQLVRLDDQMLRDGLIVKNNSQLRTLVFVPKGLLNLSKTAGASDARKADSKVKDWSIDPQYVNQKLGRLVLVGQTITYLNRVQVIARSEGAGVTPPPTVTGVNGQLVQGSKEELVVFTGTNFKDATISPPDGILVPTNSIKVDENGNSLMAKITVSETITPSEYPLVITTPAGSAVKMIKIAPAKPVVKRVEYEAGKNPEPNQTEAKNVRVFLIGDGLKTVKRISPGDPAKFSQVGEAKPRAEGGIEVVIKVEKNVSADKYKFEVDNFGEKGAFEIEVKRNTP